MGETGAAARLLMLMLPQQCTNCYDLYDPHTLSCDILPPPPLLSPGSALTFTPINLWDVHLNPTGEDVELRIPADHNTLLFVRQGRVQVEDRGE